MRCPFCECLDDKVVDSRESKEGDAIRRRRECLGCGRRFTSYERIEEIPYMVVKKDGRREPFDRQKLLHGLMKACEKRPIAAGKLERLADNVESMLQEKPEKEISTKEIGAYLMEKLKKLDKVAYVRFASVYRRFKALGEFMSEVEGLLRTGSKRGRAKGSRRR
ncbi:MAG: transcriptional regulator NrdR [Acidobacteriota bacterium]